MLGDEAFDAAYGAGTGLRLDEVAALALHVEHPDLAADSPRFGKQTPGSWPAFEPRSTTG